MNLERRMMGSVFDCTRVSANREASGSGSLLPIQRGNETEIPGESWLSLRRAADGKVARGFHLAATDYDRMAVLSRAARDCKGDRIRRPGERRMDLGLDQSVPVEWNTQRQAGSSAWDRNLNINQLSLRNRSCTSPRRRNYSPPMFLAMPAGSAFRSPREACLACG